jgi:hypothetical protein
VKTEIENALRALPAIQANAAARVQWAGSEALSPENRAKLKSDPEARATFDRLLANRDPRVKDTFSAAPGKFQNWFGIGEEKALRQFNDELSYHSATLNGILSKIAAEPSKVSMADLDAMSNTTVAMNKLLTPFYGAPPLDMNYFNKPTYTYLRRQAAKNDAMRNQMLAGPVAMQTIPSTAPNAPATQPVAAPLPWPKPK